jgi:hypothetical protein
VAQVAVLFWFYRDLPVCRNRLDVLRRDNPGTAIYGLFGGDLRDAERFRDALGPFLDDFWAFDRPVPSRWKWYHGDLVLAAWYEERGRHLPWDHVFVAQWDLLVLQPLADLLPPLADDEVLLAGVRPVAAVAHSYVFVRGGHEPAYRAFLESFGAQFGEHEPISCVFVVACLPRRLLAAYRTLDDPEAGYVEYRLPTLAAAIGLRIVQDERFPVWRPADTDAGEPTRRQRFLTGARRAIRLPTVLVELARADGARLFHPYHGLFPATPRWAAEAPVWATYVTARAGWNAVAVRAKRLAAARRSR